MPIAGLYDYPADRADLSVWSFSHMAHHRDIIRVLFQQQSVSLTEYSLDPVDPKDRDGFNAWLANHQVMHNDMDKALGIAGYDLSQVDWSDRAAMSDWLQNHGDEHYRAGQILNLG
jgi:hypothetical protein